ncbi:hypothetical protein [Ochrobactrum sp. Marseille-Q0166]|uniref:hypothetical protein n=1 Tax=Ochrobactrum sp. Marseille-Q0166 TaxID=2761105 RepID=UPI001654D1DA|nr:hypothetical protein [Ochrobactrum sp. Marseille-Q0166]MBC8718173.1 hypothetical protein [Ochrobactrum sp. Marseille-Q0166]
MKLKEKRVHSIIALIFFISFLALWYFIPQLMLNSQAVFSTVTGFASLYGLSFAIVELIRTRGVAEEVKAETNNVLLRVENLADLKLLSDCQSTIEQIMQYIDMKKAVPTFLLTQVNKIYSQHFHASINDASKPQAANVAIIRTYVASNGLRQPSNYYTNLKNTLALITTEVAMEMASKGKLGNRA